MKKKNLYILLIITLMLTPAMAIDYFNKYNEDYVLYSENYAMHLPINATEFSRVSGTYLITLSPRVTVDGTELSKPLEFDLDVPKTGEDAYVLTNRDLTDKAELIRELTIADEYIESNIKLENRNTAPINITIEYTIKKISGAITVFSPKEYDEERNTYLIVMPEDTQGPTIAVLFSGGLEQPPQNFIRLPEKKFAISKTLAPGQKEEHFLRFFPFNVQKKASEEFPTEFTGLFRDPLFIINGTVPPLDVRRINILTRFFTLRDRLRLDYATAGGDILETCTTINLIGKELISNEQIAVVKALCISALLPCRVMIGTDVSNKTTGWIRVFRGLEEGWVDISAASAADISIGRREIIYEEPIPEVHTLPNDNSSVNNYFKATAFVFSEKPKNPFLNYFIIVSVTLLILLGFQATNNLAVQRFIEHYTRKPKKKLQRLDMNKTFVILQDTAPTPFLTDILNYVIKNKGRINLRESSLDLKMSTELIESAIEKLYEKNILRLEGEEVMELEEEEKPETVMGKLSKHKIAVAIAVPLLIAVMIISWNLLFPAKIVSVHCPVQNFTYEEAQIEMLGIADGICHGITRTPGLQIDYWDTLDGKETEVRITAVAVQGDNTPGG